MNKSVLQRCIYWVSHALCNVIARVFFRARIEGADYTRLTGGMLVCSNHQSVLDPIIVGLASRRQLHYLARESLFRNRFFAKVIRLYNAIPIQRDGMGIGGIKATLKHLKQSEAVLIFPEGTRTRDGSLGELKPGFCALVRRARVPILPVGIDGAYDAWPRHRRWPRLTKIAVCFGEPIDVATIESHSDEELVETVRARIADCFDRAKALRSGKVE